MNDILIRTKKLCKTFSNGKLQTPVLFDINLEIRRGEFTALMGPSGCGKSTMMHILGLMLRPTSGEVFIDGCDIVNLTEAQRARLRREKIGFVFQRFNLLGTISAYQNIAIAQRLRGRQLDGQIDRVLKAVQMEDKARLKPGQLSMGQQQRIAIARAVVHQPDIIMADEPTGNLDSANAEQVLELLSRIQREKSVTILMITHSETAARWADRVIHMNDGRIIGD